MSKLWVATLEIEMVVYADDEKTAQRIASQHVHEETCNYGPEDVMVHRVTSSRALPGNWESDYHPYGADDDIKTILSTGK